VSDRHGACESVCDRKRNFAAHVEATVESLVARSVKDSCLPCCFVCFMVFCFSYWCLSVCSYAVFEMMPLGWLLVLLRVVPSLDANFVLVGTADSEYWINRSTQSVLGHDFFVVGQAQGGSSTSSGEEHQALLN
jgi:hypothetical protein